MNKKYFIIFLLFLIFLVSSYAFFLPGMPVLHDFIHGARTAEMLQAIQDGNIPPRWSSAFGYGYGMPLFQFYGPLPSYFGALLLFLGLPIVIVVKVLFVFSNFLSLIGAYLLGNKMGGKVSGLVAAAVFTLAPYRAINLYIRGALNESWALALLPWVLWAGLSLIDQKNLSTKQVWKLWLFLVLSVSGVILSHNLTTFMFVPLSGVLLAGLFFTKQILDKQFKTKQTLVVFGQLVGGYVMSVLLTMYYWLPSFAEKDFTQIENLIVSGYFDFHLHFLYIRQFITPGWGYGGSGWGPDDDLSFFLGYGQYCAMLVFGIGVLYTLFSTKKFTKTLQENAFYYLTTVWFGLLFLFGGYMTLGHSLPLWESWEVFSFIQFPWRWLTVMVVSLSVLAALATVSWAKKPKLELALGSIITVVCLVAGVYYFQPESYLQEPEALYYTDQTRIAEHMSEILPDYLPNNRPYPYPNAQIPEHPILSPLDLASPEKTTVILDRTHQLLVAGRFTEQETKVIFARAWFPGFVAEIDGKPVDLVATEDGLISVIVPFGEHQVSVRLENTPLRQFADTVSVLTFLSLGSYIFYRELAVS